MADDSYDDVEALSGDDTDVEVSRKNVHAYDEQQYDGSTVVIINELSKKRQEGKKFYTDTFLIGEFKWRLLFFPKGNDSSNSFSVYIEAISDTQNYRRDAKFRLTALNHLGKNPVSNHASHNFTPRGKDWGFTNFLRLEDLYDPSGGFLEDDNFHICIETSVRKEFSTLSDVYTYSARKETGYIGIMNQGATCYMNSLLQAMFHLPYFRRVVYSMHSEEGKVTIPFALQALFYRLQTSDRPVSTKQLTKSFGWDEDDSFSQHDVTEFNRVLIDTLEMKMKGTPVEGTMENLFRGQFLNYIECMRVTFKSERPEYFYDLQMPIEGCKNVYESFQKYILPEVLTGDNKYQAEGHGLQDARRGIRFKTFPDVLELNLNRFKQDFFNDRVQKINDRFEFYPVINLKQFADPNDKASPVYHLHAVLVHSGTMQGGHYTVFLRPTQGPEWYRFDDSSVRKTTERAAVDDNFGENEEYKGKNIVYRKSSSAYMLVYVRDSRVQEIFKTVENGEIPPTLTERLEREAEEQERREQERLEAERSLDIGIITKEMLFEDKQEKFDMLDLAAVPRIRARKDSTLRDFRKEYAEKHGIDDPEKIRLWHWISRKNRTERVELPFTEHELDSPLRTLDTFDKVKNPYIRIFLEVSDKPEAPYFRTITKGTTVITFFKYFDLANQTLRHVGYDFFERSDKVTDFVEVSKKLAGIPEEENVRLYEEVRPLRIDPLDMKHTLKEAELVTGDVIIVENDFPEEERGRFENPHVNQFFENILDKIVINFRPMDKPEADEFSIVLNKKMPYNEVAKRVADRINFPQNQIRLYDKAGANRLAPIPTKQLLLSLVSHAIPDETLYYEKMEMTIEEYSQLRSLTVKFWQGARRYSSVEFLVHQSATFADVLARLEKEVGSELKGTKKIRLYVSHNGFLETIVQPDMKVEGVVLDGVSLIGEEISEEELNLPKDDRLMKVMHYDVNHLSVRPQYHGVPFLVVIKKGDTYGDVTKRIRKRLRVKEEEFNFWKFALITQSSGLPQPSVLPSTVQQEIPFHKLLTPQVIGLALEHRRKHSSQGVWKEKGIAFKS